MMFPLIALKLVQIKRGVRETQMVMHTPVPIFWELNWR